MNEKQIRNECDMLDKLGHIYNMMNDGGFCGTYFDEKTEALERTLHETYHAVVRGAASLSDFNIFADRYAAVLKTKCDKRQ